MCSFKHSSRSRLLFSKFALAHVGLLRLPKERTLPKSEGIQVARPPIERVHGGHVTSILFLREQALGFIYDEFRPQGFDLDGQRFSDMSWLFKVKSGIRL